MTVSRLSKGARPERREMRAALQSGQKQECHGPESHDKDGDQGKSIEDGMAT